MPPIPEAPGRSGHPPSTPAGSREPGQAHYATVSTPQTRGQVRPPCNPDSKRATRGLKHAETRRLTLFSSRDHFFLSYHGCYFSHVKWKRHSRTNMTRFKTYILYPLIHLQILYLKREPNNLPRLLFSHLFTYLKTTTGCILLNSHTNMTLMSGAPLSLSFMIHASKSQQKVYQLPLKT